MSHYLRYFAKKGTMKKDKTRSIKLPAEIDKEFEAHCRRYGLSFNEGILRLILHELGKEDMAKKEVSVTKETPSNTQVIKKEPISIPKEIPKKYPSNTVVTHRHQSSKFTIKPYKVDGRVPCPICGTWQSYKNYARHCKDIHGGKSPQEIIEAHREKVEAMVRRARGEGGTA